MTEPRNATVCVQDVLLALDRMCSGRILASRGGGAGLGHPFVIERTSGIPGKSIYELPGLVWGKPEQPVRRVAVCMTVSEVAIELAGGQEFDLIIAHHPVADAASAGGVPLGCYLDLYGIALIEMHEVFHGTHPGIPWLHGHEPDFVSIDYGGVPGNVVFVGKPLSEIRKAGDIIERLWNLLCIDADMWALEQERKTRTCPGLTEAATTQLPSILNGSPDAPVSRVLHFFPHSGFRVEHLEQLLRDDPDIDTVVASISRVRSDHPLLEAARRRGLTFIVGNTHAREILENGLPLACALAECFPELDIQILQERVTAAPLAEMVRGSIGEYARKMSSEHLAVRARGAYLEADRTLP